MRTLVILAFLCSSTVASEILCDDAPITDQASERIPCETVTGKVNNRFQMPPGATDIPAYLWKKYHKRVDAWIVAHQQVILKYAPKIIQYIVNYQSEKNYILATIPLILKYVHKL